MLFRYFDRLRASPPAVRQRHAFVVAATITALVATGWALTLPSTLSRGGTEGAETNTTRPFSALWGQVREQWAAVFASVPGASTTPAITATVASDAADRPAAPIVLSPEDVALARASSSIMYAPEQKRLPAQIVRIATTTGASSTPPAARH